MEKYEKYKDSGVRWIGEIPEHWQVKRLKYVKSDEKNSFVDGPFGSNLKTEHFLDEGDVYVIDSGYVTSGKFEFHRVYKMISNEHFETVNRSECKENDIIISKIGANYGMSGILPKLDKLSLVSGNTLKLTVNREKYNLNFIHTQLLNLKQLGEIDLLVKGSAQPALSMGAMSDLPFLVPESIEEQTAIANYLDKKTTELDTLITKKENLIELLKEERTAIINQAVTKGLDPDVEMKDSGVDGGDRRWLGEIPAHWGVKKLKYVFDSKNTIRVPLNAEERGNMENKIYDYYGASGVIDFVDNYLFDEATILIGEDGANLLTRSKRLAFIAKGKYWVNNHAHILKPKNGNIEYLCELLELIDYTEYVSGSAQPKLTQEALMSINIFEPPIEEQNLIFNFLKTEFIRIDTIISKTNQEITLLKEYKTALISEVVTGKVKVV